MYPPTAAKPQGKLRLLYECNPLAYLIEKAGGRATDSKQRILDKVPTKLHERTGFFIGSTKMMDELESFLKEDEEKK